MSNSIKGVIVALSILLVLTAAIIFLVKNPENSSSDAQQGAVEVPSTETIFMKKTADEVAKIEIDGSYGAYAVTNLGEEQYQVQGLEDIEKDAELLSYMITNASYVRAIKTIAEKAENPEEFGFSENLSTNVTITYTDGETISFAVGGTDIVGGHTYVMINGDETIYQFDSTEVSYYKRPIAYFVDKTVTESFNTSDETPKFDKITLKTPNMPDGVTIVKNPDYDEEAVVITQKQYMLTSPHKAYLDDSNGGIFIKSIFGKMAEDAIAVSPDDAMLEKCGLLNPECVLTFSYNGKEVSLSVGNKVENSENYYVMVSGKDVIYTLTDRATNFKKLSFHDIITKNYFTKLINDVSKIEVNCEGKDYAFLVSTDDEGNTKGSYNGKDIEDILFRTFYQKLTLLAGEYKTTDAPSGETLATIKLTYTDGTSDVLVLSQGEQRRVYATLNGITDWKLRSAVVTDLADACEKVINGEEINVNW